VPFNKKEIRSIFHENSWWFSVTDVIEAVAETDRASTYWSDLKRKLSNE
jgi:prophage antirepressor-like protein